MVHTNIFYVLINYITIIYFIKSLYCISKIYYFKKKSQWLKSKLEALTLLINT